MLINKNDYDLKYRLGIIANQAIPNVVYKGIDDGVERVAVVGGTIVERQLLEQALAFSIRLYYRFIKSAEGQK